jgi:copper(I)-binding protein
MRGLPLCVLALAAFSTHAVSTFTVTEPWVRVAANGRSAEAFMQLKSSDGETVVGVRSEDVGSITMLGSGQKRTPVTRIALPAGEAVMLAPGKPRLGVGKLSKPLKLGDRVHFVLIVEAADGATREIPVNAEVRRHSPSQDHGVGHKHAAALHWPGCA